MGLAQILLYLAGQGISLLSEAQRPPAPEMPLPPSPKLGLTPPKASHTAIPGQGPANAPSPSPATPPQTAKAMPRAEKPSSPARLSSPKEVGHVSGQVAEPSPAMPTTAETMKELRLRLGRELYRVELDLQGGARIANKPCDCLTEAKHGGAVKATAEEMMSYEVNPVYGRIVDWFNQRASEFEPAEIAKRDPDHYRALAPEVRALRKKVMGTEKLQALLTLDEKEAVVREAQEALGENPEPNPGNPRQKELHSYGRLDWMPRLKVWRVIWYEGARDVPKGDYATREEAAERLQALIKASRVVRKVEGALGGQHGRETQDRP